MKFKAVALDLDGTLVDAEPYYRKLMAAAAKDVFNYSLTDAEYDAYFLGLGTAQGIIRLVEYLSGRSDPALEDKFLQSVRANSITLSQTIDFPLFNGALELLQWLKGQQIPTAIVTNTKRSVLEKYRNKYQLARLGELVHWVIAGDEASVYKPDPALYLKAAELLGVEPSEMLVVEDTKHGIRAGKNSGATVVKVNGPGGLGEDYHFDTLRDFYEHRGDFFELKGV
ncbi:hypothetical protein A2V68_02110 [candidate division Kazan bacterium RBG_13_50_9]|uniref:Uncharacterized protein n=1 Tax=candidate division Kazan bacterium RBG_13_50_9 TaxID=1798535 RepID=A0A1F4NRV8_UNCK3|nr:MAG: hypothetical protein A2V68_02110 [candidate division Kazan bacterium RBG_13_50_9]